MIILYSSPGCASCRKAKQWLKEKELKFEDDKLVGFDDFVNSYKESDPSAFIEEKKEEPSVTVSTGGNHNDTEK